MKILNGNSFPTVVGIIKQHFTQAKCKSTAKIKKCSMSVVFEEFRERYMKASVASTGVA